MKRTSVVWITRTAVMLALLVVLQWATKPLGQIVTGSLVNGVLALTALLLGIGSGITVALISPVAAFLLGIAPNAITVPAIMLGNACYVAVLHVLSAEAVWRRIAAWLASALLKFAVLYLVVVELICGVLSDALMGKTLILFHTPLLAPPMVKLLPAMFSWPQLVTALIGGAAAMISWPPLRKAMKE